MNAVTDQSKKPKVFGEPWYKCPQCGCMGYASVFPESGCTSCSNLRRFGAVLIPKENDEGQKSAKDVGNGKPV